MQTKCDEVMTYILMLCWHEHDKVWLENDINCNFQQLIRLNWNSDKLILSLTFASVYDLLHLSYMNVNVNVNEWHSTLNTANFSIIIFNKFLQWDLIFLRRWKLYRFTSMHSNLTFFQIIIIGELKRDNGKKLMNIWNRDRHANIHTHGSLTIQSDCGFNATDTIFTDAFVSSKISLMQVFYGECHLNCVHRVLRFMHRMAVIRYYHFAYCWFCGPIALRRIVLVCCSMRIFHLSRIFAITAAVAVHHPAYYESKDGFWLVRFGLYSFHKYHSV